MHELSLCAAMRDVIEDHARRHAVTRVSRVRVELGAFACVSREALTFAFDVVMRGSVAEGAVLSLAQVPGMARCHDCRREVAVEDRFGPCPGCGGARLVPVADDQVRIRDMEAA